MILYVFMCDAHAQCEKKTTSEIWADVSAK